jgi:hypothetical protein
MQATKTASEVEQAELQFLANAKRISLKVSLLSIIELLRC